MVFILDKKFLCRSMINTYSVTNNPNDSYDSLDLV